MRQGTVENNLKKIFQDYPALMLPQYKKKCVRYYWHKYDGVAFPMGEDDHDRATPDSSIVRAWRRLSPYKNMKEEEAYRHYYSNSTRNL